MKLIKKMPLEFKPIIQENEEISNDYNTLKEKDIYFIPEKGFCIETKILMYKNYKQVYIPLFINICWSDNVNNAKAKIANACHHHCHHHHHHHHESSIKDSTGIKNYDENRWDIPYVVHRQYKDNQLKIYDFVVGSKPFKRCLKDEKFKDIIIQTSIQVIEEKYSETIQKDNLIVHKDIKYKEIPSVSNIDTLKSSFQDEFIDKINENLKQTPNLHFIQISQKKTLTDHQRDILYKILIENYYNNSMYDMNIPLISFSIDSPLFDDKLKVFLPSFKIIQCKSFIRFIFCISNIIKSSIRLCIDDSSLECTFMDKDDKEYSLFTYLNEKINLSLSYATFIEESHSPIVIILKKLNNDIWDIPIKLL